LGLALVRDLRELREPSSAEEIEAFETDVLAGFVLARASAGLVGSTIRNDINHLELVRDWFGRQAVRQGRRPTFHRWFLPCRPEAGNEQTSLHLSYPGSIIWPDSE
jgi:hypothetical protein